jgi:hypothetical protein
LPLFLPSIRGLVVIILGQKRYFSKQRIDDYQEKLLKKLILENILLGICGPQGRRGSE